MTSEPELENSGPDSDCGRDEIAGEDLADIVLHPISGTKRKALPKRAVHFCLPRYWFRSASLPNLATHFSQTRVVGI
jgi:hypothetical protein